MKHKTKPLIILIGMMGAGKTSVGKQLARLLGWGFIDMDREIEHRSGASVPLIFEKEGEEGFRRRETAVLKDLLQKERFVIATGGGVVTREENRQLLKGDWPVIFLDVQAEEVLRRTQGCTTRPLLLTGDPRARIEKLIEERTPLYLEVQNVRVESNATRPEQMARKLLKLDTLASFVFENSK